MDQKLHYLPAQLAIRVWLKVYFGNITHKATVQEAAFQNQNLNQ